MNNLTPRQRLRMYIKQNNQDGIKAMQEVIAKNEARAQTSLKNFAKSK